MRDTQQHRQRLAGQPPDGCAEAEDIENQRQRFQRHDDQCGQRDSNDIGRCAVGSGAMKVKQADWRQRQFDDNSRQ